MELAREAVSPPRLQVVRDDPVDPVRDSERAVDRDVSAALGDLIGRFDAFIRRTASRHGLSGSDIDDVVQDLRLRLWRSFGTQLVGPALRRTEPAQRGRVAAKKFGDVDNKSRAVARPGSTVGLNGKRHQDRAESQPARSLLALFAVIPTWAGACSRPFSPRRIASTFRTHSDQKGHPREWPF